MVILFLGGFYSDDVGYVARSCKKCPNGSFVLYDKTPGTRKQDCKTCPEGNSFYDVYFNYFVFWIHHRNNQSQQRSCYQFRYQFQFISMGFCLPSLYFEKLTEYSAVHDASFRSFIEVVSTWIPPKTPSKKSLTPNQTIDTSPITKNQKPIK